MQDKIKNMKTKIGAHFPYVNELQIYGVVSDAIQIGANSGSFNISNPKTYKKGEQDLDLIESAHKLAEKFHLELKNFVVQCPDVGNLADISENEEVFNKTVDSYLSDIRMAQKAGVLLYNIRPGKCKDKEKGIEKIAEGINMIHDLSPDNNVSILLETMADSDNWIGGTFEELAQIIELVENKERVGVCMDTSHVWSAGYDIEGSFEGVLREFDAVIGLDYLKALHISDSKSELGSQIMRKEDIGLGKIGEHTISSIVNHRKLQKIPKTLETPLGAKNYTKWMEEVEMLS